MNKLIDIFLVLSLLGMGVIGIIKFDEGWPLTLCFFPGIMFLWDILFNKHKDEF